MNIKQIFAVSALSITTLASANAADFEGTNKSSYTNLCMAALSGNKPQLYHEIRASGFSHSYVANNINCNDENLVSFVQQHGRNADEMVRMLERRELNVDIIDIARLDLHEQMDK